MAHAASDSPACWSIHPILPLSLYCSETQTDATHGFIHHTLPHTCVLAPLGTICHTWTPRAPWHTPSAPPSLSSRDEPLQGWGVGGLGSLPQLGCQLSQHTLRARVGSPERPPVPPSPASFLPLLAGRSQGESPTMADGQSPPSYLELCRKPGFQLPGNCRQFEKLGPQISPFLLETALSRQAPCAWTLGSVVVQLLCTSPVSSPHTQGSGDAGSR